MKSSNIMKKHQTIVRIMMALVIMFGVETTASAQFGKLLKKAKESLNVQIGSGDSDDSSSSSSSSSFSGSHPKKLKDLNKELFIYQPVDDPVNAPFYDINNPKAKEYYDQFCALDNRPIKDPSVEYWLFEFLDYQSPTKGLKQVHCTEYPLTAYFSYAMTHPKDVQGFRCYIRAKVIFDVLTISLQANTLPYVQGKLGWSLEYPKSDEMRKITLKDGTALSLLESEKARADRWRSIKADTEEIISQNVTYEIIKSAMKETMAEGKKAMQEGRFTDAFNLIFREYHMMKYSWLERDHYHSIYSKDEDYMDLDDEYKPMYDLYYFDWRNAIENEYIGTAEMPKEASVSADIKSQATQQARAKFGAKFVKAIVVESDWHVYTDPNNFNRTDHRSINVDVITKDGDQYYISHQMLWQNYQAGSWGSYDMRQKSFGQQKVNYK